MTKTRRPPVKSSAIPREAPKSEPTVVDPDYRRWISERPCIACLYLTGRVWYPSEPVLVYPNAGDAANLLPLCADHHRLGDQAFQRIGLLSFARYVGFDPARKAREYQDWYDAKEALPF